MRATLARIGNSRGIRIPKPLLEASGIIDEVELGVEDGRLIVTPVPHPRAGWEAAFAAAPAAPDEETFADDLSNGFDDVEWAW
jgi:antitoxin MazE